MSVSPIAGGLPGPDIAAHLVDEMLPKVAILQGVLAYDRALCADVLDALIGALRWRAERALGLRSLALPIGAVKNLHEALRLVVTARRPLPYARARWCVSA